MEDEGLGGRLRGLRQAAGLTREELAAGSGLGVRTIRYLEAGTVGRPRWSSLRLLARTLGVGIEDLVPPPRRLVGGQGLGSQLPAEVVEFTGRAAEADRLAGLLTAGGMPVALVHGRPGIGKTALAVRVGHAVELLPGRAAVHTAAWRRRPARPCGRARPVPAHAQGRTGGDSGGAGPPT